MRLANNEIKSTKEVDMDDDKSSISSFSAISKLSVLGSALAKVPGNVNIRLSRLGMKNIIRGTSNKKVHDYYSP